jgi:hypothetical protein
VDLPQIRHGGLLLTRVKPTEIIESRLLTHLGSWRAISFYAGQISLYAGRISLYAGQISFNAGTHKQQPKPQSTNPALAE